MFKKIAEIIFFSIPAFMLCSCEFSVNESYHLSDGEKMNSGINTINGVIEIGANCVVRGTCRTVNGNITVGRNSIIKGIQTVNGAVEIGENVTVKRDIKTVTSKMFCDKGSHISGDIFAINANIKLRGCRIKGDVEVKVGKIVLQDKTEVHGSIIIGETGNTYEFGEPASVEIYILGGSIIEGDIDIRQNGVDTRVHLASGGSVRGEINAALVIRDP